MQINGENPYIWRAADHKGEVLEAFATSKRDRSAVGFLKPVATSSSAAVYTSSRPQQLVN
ncbi:MAG: DDE-type integrase/transposase/recombinase [Sneathiella sp.]|nr:DDE-type integrase/transposase/recombinase [Sneathiella sp.]